MTIRKWASKLSVAEQQRFITTITTLNTGKSPTPFAQLVADHADMSHVMHGSIGPVGRQRFLPWHRDFLLQLEQAMQAIDPLAFIPYWKWSVNRQVPAWIASTLPTVKLPAINGMGGMGGMGATTVKVWRSPHQAVGLPTAAQIRSLDANTSLDYTQFTALLESYHNTVHGWVGGTMNNILVSPADPLFWMNHAEIDRIWAAWQANPANAGKSPSLAGQSRVMDPWPQTASSLQSISAIGYSYAL